MTHPPVRIALLGCGTVGTAVARRLVDHADEFASRVGRPVEVTGVAVTGEHLDHERTGGGADRRHRVRRDGQPG